MMLRRTPSLRIHRGMTCNTQIRLTRSRYRVHTGYKWEHWVGSTGQARNHSTSNNRSPCSHRLPGSTIQLDNLYRTRSPCLKTCRRGRSCKKCRQWCSVLQGIACTSVSRTTTIAQRDMPYKPRSCTLSCQDCIVQRGTRTKSGPELAPRSSPARNTPRERWSSPFRQEERSSRYYMCNTWRA
jgi:hypothetical protein